MTLPRQRTFLAGLLALLAVAMLCLLGLVRGGSEETDDPLIGHEPEATAPDPPPVADAPEASARRGDTSARDASAPVVAVAPPSALDLALDVVTLSEHWVGDAESKARLGDQDIEGGETARFEFYAQHQVPRTASLTFVAGPNAGRALSAGPTGVAFAEKLLPGKNVVTVAIDRYPVFKRMVRIRPRIENSITFRAGRTGWLSGTVTDVTGRPLPQATVAVDGEEVRTDDDGRYRVDNVFPGDGILVRVSKSGFVPVERAVDMNYPHELSFRFYLLRGARVRGRVLTTETNPLPRIWVLPGGGVSSAEERTFPFHWDGVYANKAVNADGTFELEGLPTGCTLRVLARHPRFPLSHPDSFTLSEPGLARRFLCLQPLAGATLIGQVIDHKGQPVADARVECRPEKQPSNTSELTTVLRVLELSPRMLEAHVIGRELLRLDATETTTGKDGGFVLGRPWQTGAQSLRVEAQGHPGFVERLVGDGDLVRNVALAAAERGVIAPAESGLAAGVASLRLVFGVPAEVTPPRLRVVVRIDGRRDQAAFEWDTQSPLVLPVGTPRHVRLSGAVSRDRRVIESIRIDDLLVAGQVDLPISLARLR